MHLPDGYHMMDRHTANKLNAELMDAMMEVLTDMSMQPEIANRLSRASGAYHKLEG